MRNQQSHLTIDGEAAHPLTLSFADLAALPAAEQVNDVSRLDPKRSGDAVKLSALLDRAGAKPGARWLTLHATADDFHASIPLGEARERAILIYRLGGEPLPAQAGGPFRFFIPDITHCHGGDINECANVKFVDRLELSVERGYDNRPDEEAEHEELHRRQAQQQQQ